jgi:hypothetical protein
MNIDRKHSKPFRPYKSVEFLRGTQQICTVQCFLAMIDGRGNTVLSVRLMQPERFIRGMLPCDEPFLF